VTLEECQGIAEVLAEEGWTLDMCLSLAYGEVILEFLNAGLLCTQFVATGEATPGGVMVHARNLDWDFIEYWAKNHTVIVRHPSGRIPYVVLGFPGNVAPYTGMNAAGISVASNEALSHNDIDRVGRPHTQMLTELLSTSTSLTEAIAFLKAQDHMTAEIFTIADGDNNAAAVFEMSASHIGIRQLDENGVVYATNHFVIPEMAPYHIVYPDDASSRTRLARLVQLGSPGGTDSLHGTLDAAAAISVLRDRHNPYFDIDVPEDQFDGGGSIANNGCIHSVVFLPKQRAFYFASGMPPVPSQPYLGFTLSGLFGLADSTRPSPPRID